jgi:carboxymethylenebutenolidase
MTVATEWVTYGEQGEYTGFVARMDRLSGTAPAVIVIQEIWGVDSHIQDVTKRIAQAGYVAFAPDLFTYAGNKPDYLQADRLDQAKSFMDSIPPAAGRNPEERKRYMTEMPEGQAERINESLDAIFGGHSKARFPDTVKRAAQFLREEYLYSKGEGVASVGYCLGGALSGWLACEDPQLKAAVVYYGNPPETEQISSIACPVLGFYGEKDKRISELIPAFASEMKAASKSFESHIYPDAPHAFFNDTRPSYHPDASRASFARMLTFLSDALTR